MAAAFGWGLDEARNRGHFHSPSHRGGGRPGVKLRAARLTRSNIGRRARDGATVNQLMAPVSWKTSEDGAPVHAQG